MLPEMFKDTRETDAVLGPVVAAGLEALKVRFCCLLPQQNYLFP